MSSISGPTPGRSPSSPEEGSSDVSHRDSLAEAPRHQRRTRKTSAYCSATDRNVPVLVELTRTRSRAARPSYREAERLVCLDYGVRCTGWLCPLFDVPTLSEHELEEPPARGH